MSEDLISRDAVLDACSQSINILDAMSRIEDLPSVTPMYTEITLESAIDYLNSIGWMQEHDRILTESAQSVTPKQRWIPVSERLPDKYTYTLWCASSGYVRSDYFNGEFWEDAKKYCYEVIAWMPLPKPYEPQESE